ncbi:MAG: galactose-1-phosphate uridylyltransferase [Candidatus Eremiobacteraeota bacterium]|nr:galactose-1-phosphate uridylyltransferase [Candidatus Eremiobacteraeota bacterium]
MSELRYNRLLAEWTATATQRQDRTFLPPAGFCPLCPTKPGGFETEVPDSDYYIAVLQNRFPSLQPDPPAPDIEGSDLFPVRPSKGVCEVVLYTPQHDASFSDLSVDRIEDLLLVWTERYSSLGALDFVEYVYIFENKGTVVGVTLHHPHGQIYAYPFVPPVVERELRASSRYYDTHGRCLLCDLQQGERDDGRRIVGENEDFVAYVPFAARYPYEVHVVTKRHSAALSDFDANQQRECARILKSVTRAYDKLFNQPFPYVMAMHQKPTDGGEHPYYHFHVEFYPPMRSESKLKYLAGSELGAGMFINDTHAEEKAAELRSHWEDS